MNARITLTILATIASAVSAADTPLVWPAFRGPNGSGVAEAQNPPVELGPDKNVKWKITAPSGLSSPIIVGDLLVLTAFDNEKLYTIAYRRADGAEAWRAEAPAAKFEPFHKTEGSPAASTPATDGSRIVSYFGSCGLFCYDLAGKELWKHELPTAITQGEFGSGVSPIMADGLVVLVRDVSQDPKIIALDAATGALKWERQRRPVTSYSTPVVWDTPQGRLVVVAGHGRMTAYDLKTGEEVWFVPGMPAGCCPSPIVNDGMLYFAGWSPGGPDEPESGLPPFDAILNGTDINSDGALSREEAQKTDFRDFFDNNDPDKDGQITRAEWDVLLKFLAEGRNRAFALKPGGGGDVSTTHILWEQTKGLPYIATALACGGQLVMVKDGGIVTAFDLKSGELVFRERVAGQGGYYASPVAANNHIYFASLEGVITVLKAGAAKPEVAAQNPTLGERVSATPAIADDCLYVRTEKHLYAFGK